MRHRTLVLAAALAVLLAGCATLSRLSPGGIGLTDSEWSGVAGVPVSIIGTLDPRAGQLALLLQVLGQGDPLGVLLPVTPAGETQPRWILCADKFADTCRGAKLNSTVHFAGQPIGPGLLWRPTRIKVDG